MSKCHYCDYTSDSNITCPKCNTNLCIYCIRISMIHNDGQYLCPSCNNDLHNYIVDFSSKYYKDDVIQVDNINKHLNSNDACVICYYTLDENNILRCNTCHQPYCYDCFKRLIKSNPEHICAMCRQYLSAELINRCMERVYMPKKKRCFGHEQGSNIYPFDINNTIISCKYCKEHFEYDTLISYFTSKHKYDKTYIPDCPHCHTKWGDNKFMYDTFGRDFCKGVLNLFDPYACKVCQERKELVHCKVCADCLKQHFQTNENAFFDCSECHEKFTVNFMFENFEPEYCRDILHLVDPFACKYCYTRFYPTYTCKYCNTKICKVCERQHLEQATKNNERLDCINCHHYYSSTDLYEDIFDNDKDFVQKILHIEYPFECKLCRKDLKWAIKDPDYYRVWVRFEFITCEYCEKHYCKDCLFSYLRTLAEDYKKNTINFQYIPDGFYKCPCCNYNISSIFLFKKYYDKAHDNLYLIDPSKRCVKCNKYNYNLFYCYECSRYNCLECLCEQQIKRIINHPEIKFYSELPCINCGKQLIKSTNLYKHLDEQTCKELRLESEIDKILRENLKNCPNPVCGEKIMKVGGCDHMWCPKCHTMFNWSNLKIIHTTTNPLYFQWLRQTGYITNNNNTLNDESINNISSIYNEEQIDKEHFDEEQLDENETYICNFCNKGCMSEEVIKCPKCKQYLCFNCLDNIRMLKDKCICIFCEYDLTDIIEKK